MSQSQRKRQDPTGPLAAVEKHRAEQTRTDLHVAPGTLPPIEDNTNTVIPIPVSDNGAVPRSGTTNTAISRPGATNTAISRPGATNTAIPRPGATNTAIPRPGATNTAIPRPGATNTAIPRPGATNTAIPRPGITPTPAPTTPPARTAGQTDPTVGRIRSEEELTQTNTLSLNSNQMKEMQERLHEVRSELKPPSLFARLKKFAILGGVLYGLYYVAVSGMITPFLSMLSENPALKQMIDKLPKVVQPKERRQVNRIDEAEHRDPRAVVKNFNNRLKSYKATLDSVADGTGDNRAVSEDGYETADARVRRLSSLTPPGKSFPFAAGNLIVVESGKNSGTRCKIIAEHGSAAGPIYQLNCQTKSNASAKSETYYFSRDSLQN